MKKALSLFLSLILILCLVPMSSLASVSASGIDQITVDKSQNVTWDSSITTKYVYLTVPTTGFYDISFENLYSDYALTLSLYDLNDETAPWNNTYVYDETYTDSTEHNLPLIGGHMYEITLRCGYYDDNADFISMGGSTNILVASTDYSPMEINLNSTIFLTVGNNTRDWAEFHTTAAGDYMFNTNQTTPLTIYVYNKTSGELECSLDYSSYYEKRIYLDANSDYIMEIQGHESNSKLVRFQTFKADANVTKIDIIQNDTILPNGGYVDSEYASLHYNTIENFEYKVTFSDNHTETLPYYGLQTMYGIYIRDIEYAGAKHETNGEYLFKTGKQKVKVYWNNAKPCISYVKITSFLNFVTELNEMSDYEDMYIKYGNHSDTNSHTYYWHIKPDETNAYDFYSSDWDQIGCNFAIFDKNDKSYTRHEDGFYLTAGTEYCLRINYWYNEDSTGDVRFWLRPHRDHVHKQTTVTKKATTSANGYTYKKCSLCNNTTKKTTIYKASKVSLSKTSYTYNGKVQKPSVVVKDSKGKTISSKHYTVTYASGRKNVGTYKVTVKFKGNYSGTKTLYFTINPVKTTLGTLTAAKKALTVKWTKKAPQISGYQIQYSTTKSFKSYKTKTVSSYKTTSAKLTGLSAKKTYYVRVRTYKTVNGKKYYSGWSTIKYKKTK